MYSKGNQTKQAIISSAKKLFYEKGFYAATSSAIMAGCGQRQSLFFYYFKDSYELAMEIYDEFQNEHFSLIQQQLDPSLYTDLEMINIRGISHVSLVLTDKKVARFVSEVSYQGAIQANEFIQQSFNDAAKKYIPKGKNITGEFIIAQTLSLSACIFKLFAEDKLHTPIKDIIEMKTESNLRVFYLSGQQLEETKKRCLEAVSMLAFKIEPYFKIVSV